MKDSRYQFQPFYIRWYRWWRWKPFFSYKALIQWLATDSDFRLYWRVAMTNADIRMEHYYSLEELLEEMQ